MNESMIQPVLPRIIYQHDSHTHVLNEYYWETDFDRGSHYYNLYDKLFLELSRAFSISSERSRSFFNTPSTIVSCPFVLQHYLSSISVIVVVMVRGR
jgi:hypothetical protein